MIYRACRGRAQGGQVKCHGLSLGSLGLPTTGGFTPLYTRVFFPLSDVRESVLISKVCSSRSRSGTVPEVGTASGVPLSITVRGAAGLLQ